MAHQGHTTSDQMSIRRDSAGGVGSVTSLTSVTARRYRGVPPTPPRRLARPCPSLPPDTRGVDVTDTDAPASTAGAARRPLYVLFLLTALMSLGYGGIFTLLADIRDRFGFSDADVGLIAFAGFATGFTSQVVLARYADRGHTALDAPGRGRDRRLRHVRHVLRDRALGVGRRPAPARARVGHRRAGGAATGDHPGPRARRRQPRHPDRVRRERLRDRTDPRRCARRAHRTASPVRRARRCLRGHAGDPAAAQPPDRGHGHRAPGGALAPRAPCGPVRAVRGHRVLPDARHVRGAVVRAAARPRRRDVADRAHPQPLHHPHDHLRSPAVVPWPSARDRSAS